MGSFAATDHRVEVNAVVLSTFINNVEMPVEYAELEDTAYGDTARSRLAGLQDSTLTLEGNQDFAAGGPDVTIWGIRGTVVVVKVRPTTAAIGTTNPEYVGSYLVSQWQPFGTAVGERGEFSVEWPLADADGIARNTT